MASILDGTNLGNSLQTLLMSDEIVPGNQPSYETCKVIYLYHPLGGKMAESPVKLAQSQMRNITIEGAPELEVKQAFQDKWISIGADDIILNAVAQARVYGIATLALLVGDTDPSTPVDWPSLYKREISFNVLDPLNTSGSQIRNQDPNAMDFQKSSGLVVQGQAYHKSRFLILTNEKPIYLAYTTSAFGYVGRSVYQRALFPLKTFINSMRTDDMVMRKGGLLVAMIKQAGSAVNKAMTFFTGQKRALLKEAELDQVLSIGESDKVETLNMQNLEGPVKMARQNILENIAMAADMPAKLLNQETFAEGFGEGTEDAKAVARYIERLRLEMHAIYEFMDRVVQRLAWTPDFYKSVQSKYDEYKKVDFNSAFYQWANAFHATWPNLLTEPDSEKLKGEEEKFKTILSAVEILLPKMDPVNAAILLGWLQDNLNENKLLVASPLVLDMDVLSDYLEQAAQAAKDLQDAATEPDEEEPKPPRAMHDSNGQKRYLEAAE